MKIKKQNLTKLFAYLVASALMLTMCLSPYAAVQARAEENPNTEIDDLTPEEIAELEAEIDAVELTPEEEKKVDELAKDLEFISEETAIRDEDGDIIGFDQETLEKEYKDNPEYEAIKNELENVVLVECDDEYIDEDIDEGGGFSTLAKSKKENPKWRAASNSCIKSQLKANYGLWAFTGLATGVIDAMNRGAYKTAATKMVKSAIKLGIKANAVGIAINLLYIVGHCGDVASKKYKKWI